MKKIFKNKKKYTFKLFISTFLFFILNTVIFGSLTMGGLSLFTSEWYKQRSVYIIVGSLFIYKFLFKEIILLACNKHLQSIYIDEENKRLIVTHLRFFKPNIQSTIEIEEIIISKIKEGWIYNYFEISPRQPKLSIAAKRWYHDYFGISNNQQKISISASKHFLSQKKLEKIHHKLYKKLNIDIQNNAFAVN